MPVNYIYFIPKVPKYICKNFQITWLHCYNKKSSAKEGKNMLESLLVGIGGFIGSVLRYLIGLLPMKPENGFPVKTLFINIAGSFIIGMIVADSCSIFSTNDDKIN